MIFVDVLVFIHQDVAVSVQQSIPHLVWFDPGNVLFAFQQFYRPLDNAVEIDPVFIVGESYGGFRAILVAKRLLHSGFKVRGAVLISPVIEYSLIRGDAITVLPIALSLVLSTLITIIVTGWVMQRLGSGSGDT